MAYTPPVVSYSTTVNGTYTELTGIQSVSIRRGRQRFSDPFPPTTCVIELIPANSYVTPLEVGQFVDVRTSNSGTAPAFFVGRISDVERDYATPYDPISGAAPADRIIITVLGGVGVLGQSGAYVKFAGGFAEDALFELRAVINTAGVYHEQIIGIGNTDAYNKFGVLASIENNVEYTRLDLINALLRCGPGFIDDMNNERTKKVGRDLEVRCYKQSIRSWTFSDVNTGANIFKYAGIKYLSGADTAFTEIEVTGYPPTTTTGTANTGVSQPYNQLQYKTQLREQSNVNSMANYLLAIQNDTEPTPFVLRTSTVVADGVQEKIYMPITKSPNSVYWFDQIIGATVIVEFRGTTVQAQLQGVNANFYADQANFEFYLSPYLGVPFTLDSTINGVLDTNRLGYP